MSETKIPDDVMQEKINRIIDSCFVINAASQSLRFNPEFAKKQLSELFQSCYEKQVVPFQEELRMTKDYYERYWNLYCKLWVG